MTTIKPILVSTLLKTLNIVTRYTQYIGQYIAYSVHTQYIKVRDRARRMRSAFGTLSNFSTSLLPDPSTWGTPGTGALALYRHGGEQNNKTQILDRGNVDMISPFHLVSTLGTVLTRAQGLGSGVPVFGRLRTENGLVRVPTPAQNFLGFVGSVSTRKFVGQFPQPVSTFHISTGRAI